MKKILFIASFVCYINTFAQNQPAEKSAFTLDEAKKYGVEHHYTAKNSQYESKFAEISVKKLTAVGLPQINAEGNFQNFINLPVSLVPANAFGLPSYVTDFFMGLSQLSGVPFNQPAASNKEFSELKFGTKFNSNGGITVNQLIFDGSYIYGLKAAKAYADMSKQQEQKTAEDISCDVEKAYYMVLIAQENVKLLSSSKNTLQDLLTQISAYHDAGFIEEQDVDQLQLTLSGIENSLTNAQMQYELALDMLKFKMGYPLESNISLVESIETLTGNVNELLIKSDFNPQSNIDIKLMDSREQLLKLNKKVESSKIYPRLVGFFSHTENTYSNQFKVPNKWYPTTLWGLKLQVPLYNGGSYFSTVKQTQLEIERIQEAKKYAEQGLILQYTATKNEFTTAVNESKQSKSSLELAQKIREKTKIKFKEGLSSSMDMSQSENQYLSAQGAYIGSLLKLLNAKANLKKLTK